MKSKKLLLNLAGLLLLGACAPALADAPGGILEQPLTAQVRARPTAAQIQSFLPERGAFTFPAPYNTRGVRLTNASDCGGSDCVFSVGYSYWRNINNHVGSDTLYAFVGLKGGRGPTLFSYNKLTEETRNLGPLFDAGSGFASRSGEGWYFSGTHPTRIYLDDGPRMLRYDVISKQLDTVFDVRTQYGADKVIWQMQSSDDDRVHSATLRATPSYEMLGCVVYHEDTAQFQYFPKVGGFDECHVDKSGRWLMSLESITGYGNDMRIFDLTTGDERLVSDPDGAVGHPDMGYGYVVGADNWSNLPNAQKVWNFSNSLLSGSLVHQTISWDAAAPNHTSHTNARPGVAIADQFACGSGATTTSAPWGNEIICFRLDGSMNVMVAAPVMTDMNAAAGGDAYDKQPKGNLDITGEYFIWTTNTGGARVDAFIVKLPSQLLFGGSPQPAPTPTPTPTTTPDTAPPAVSIATPPDGSTISGTVNVTANATDNVGVVSVQYQLDGVDAGPLLTAAPYTVAWNTESASTGVHVISAIARDAAGNQALSVPVTVTVVGADAVPPAISAVMSTNVTSSAATITWTTGELSDSQVEYGTTTAYGAQTTLGTAYVLAHTETLSGLAPGTLYHYRVRSRDLSGNLTVSAEATFTTAAAATPSGAQNVAWTSLVNVTANGNSIQKTGGCDGCEDAGAVSQQQIGSGDGFLEFTVSETSYVRFIGLNNNSTGTTAAEIPFAFKLVSGTAEVRERGQYTWDTPVASGDVLRIAVQSGVVRYSKNGAIFYTSTATAVYPLRADTALTSTGATVSNVQMAGASAATAAQSVVWTNRINTTVSGSTLKKTGGCDGCEDAGAVSQQQITSANGYLKFTVSETSYVRFIGLNHNSVGTGAAEIPFAYKLVSGTAEVRENGQYRADTRVVTGDVLQIKIQSGVVKYVKNGVTFYTSSATPAYPLRADTAFTSLGGTVKKAIISSGP